MKEKLASVYNFNIRCLNILPEQKRPVRLSAWQVFLSKWLVLALKRPRTHWWQNRLRLGRFCWKSTESTKRSTKSTKQSTKSKSILSPMCTRL